MATDLASVEALLETLTDVDAPSVDPLELVKIRGWLRDGTARAIREKAGLSQSEVARGISVNEMTVMRWESGRRTPHGPNAIALLRLLEGLLGR